MLGCSASLHRPCSCPNTVVAVCMMTTLNCIHFSEYILANSNLLDSFSLNTCWKCWTWLGACSLLMLNDFLAVLACLQCKRTKMLSGVWLLQLLVIATGESWTTKWGSKVNEQFWEGHAWQALPPKMLPLPEHLMYPIFYLWSNERVSIHCQV